MKNKKIKTCRKDKDLKGSILSDFPLTLKKAQTRIRTFPTGYSDLYTQQRLLSATEADKLLITRSNHYQ